MRLKAEFYQQFDADYTLDVPAEGFGGWQSDTVEINPKRTAVVVMHATDSGSQADYPGIYRCCEEIPQTVHVANTVLPGLLAAARASELSVFHVASGEHLCRDYPGYQRAVALTGEAPPTPQVEPDPVYAALAAFRRDRAFPGKHNLADCAASDVQARFLAPAVPIGDEGIAINERQLFALCREAGVNHLIYAGFNVNWCILRSRGGIVEMSRHGLFCSAFRQAVTGVENRQTARRELGKELGLWIISVDYGLIFDVSDFIAAVGRTYGFDASKPART